jgi:hypothetical protein
MKLWPTIRLGFGMFFGCLVCSDINVFQLSSLMTRIALCEGPPVEFEANSLKCKREKKGWHALLTPAMSFEITMCITIFKKISSRNGENGMANKSH